MPKMTTQSSLKKYSKLDGYSANASSVGGFKKHLSLKFKISEFELHKAINSNKIRIYVQ
jgi:hypothetical protein